MNDPHVVSLTYRVVPVVAPDCEIRYVDPEPLEIDRPGFRGRLEDQELVLKPKDHFPTVQSARAIADRFVRGWEVDAHLAHRSPALAFEFVMGDVVDRDPPPLGSSQSASVEGAATSGGCLIACVTRSTYPEPPVDFEFTRDVEVLWDRLEGYPTGREPILSMASFCLRWIEMLAGGRREAAKLLRVDYPVLDKLGELTSTRGGPRTARKVKNGTPLQPLTLIEEAWIVWCLEALIRRVGEAATDSATRLTLGDLPRL